ncbi:MAG: AAA family ATPase, partial [Planctomycetota bacterium]|nr:AAA family ATPase [Planctomycetota bacterium]
MPDPLPANALRWRCDPESLPFETTAEVEPVAGVVGQQSAVEALRFGIESDAPGQNVFVRGLTGTGRMTMVRRLLDELMPSCPIKQDRCYVHNFKQPDRPRLITVPPQHGRELRRQVQELSDFVRKGLVDALETDAMLARREAVEAEGRAELDKVTGPFEESLKEAGLALVSMQQGQLVQTALFPVVDGKTLQPDEFEELRSQGKITDEQHEAFKRSVQAFQKKLGDVTLQVQRIRRATGKDIRRILEETVRRLLEDMAASIRESFPGEDVATFLGEVIDDVIERVSSPPVEGEDPTRLYGVNILMEHDEDPTCPIVVENSPTLANLLGTVEREWNPRGPTASDYSMIRAGSLLRADGGYLILDARDLLGEPGAWKVLMRTLRHGRLEIVPPEMGWPFFHQAVKPEPIPINVRVILVGDAEIYYLLDSNDPDFGHLFKVLADFDSVIDREPDGVRQYAGVLARIADEESLPAFHKTAVAALAEYGARVASHHGKLTARFARIADIAREAAFLTRKEERATVTAEDVFEAVRRTKQRADLPSRRFQKLLAEGTIVVQTEGEVIGQINGLAVMHAGMLTYGFPARITATIGPGSAGIVDIEASASLSGAIHTKGFHILGGCLRHLLQTDHALAFSASLAFEQSY